MMPLKKQDPQVFAPTSIMKIPIAITLITMGGLLILAPVVISQLQLQRATAYREQHGAGSELPEESRPQPFGRYEWACFSAGTVFALAGIFGSLRSRTS